MKPPNGVKVQEDQSSMWWIDEDDIVCSVSKKKPIHRTREEMIVQFENFKKMNGERKVCILFDISDAQPGTSIRRETDLIIEGMEKIVKAMAVISSSALGRLLINLFFNLKTPSYPMKIFDNERDAKAWLKKHL